VHQITDRPALSMIAKRKLLEQNALPLCPRLTSLVAGDKDSEVGKPLAPSPRAPEERHRRGEPPDV
jgi:hypothetical protein